MVRNVSVTPKGAAYYYHHPKFKFNCAQSIVYHYGGNSDEVALMSKMGTGKAPQGYCGALHGALFLLRNNKKIQEKIIHDFAHLAGSPACQSIRKQKTTSCRQCVEIADKILKDYSHIIP